MKKLLLLIALLLMAGCMKPGPTKIVTLPNAPHKSTFNNYVLSSGDTLDAVYLFENVSDYTLQTGDLVDIQFPLQTDLNIQQRIRPDGMITLPYIADLKIVGLSPQHVSRMLTKKYSSIMRQPTVEFLVVESNSEVEILKSVFATSSSGQSRRLTVRPDGRITLPGIGEVQAEGQTLAALSDHINERYQCRWPEVKVDLILEEAYSLKVYVLGEVEEDGEYQITSPLTIAQVLALAGGRTPVADGDTVFVARRNGNQYICDTYKLDNNFVAQNGTIPMLGANDILYVPKSGLSAAAQAMQELSQIILFRGWGFHFNYGLNDNWEWGF